jgi:hypothetical protein
MFNSTLRTSPSRVRSVWVAAFVGLLASGAAAASAQASAVSPPVSGEAVIASVGDTTVNTTSGSGESPDKTAARASTASASGALTLNSGGTTTDTPTRTPSSKKASSATQIGDSNFTAPTIVGSTSAHRAAAPAPGALSQIQSAGPIVASSGTAHVVAKHTSDRTSGRAGSATDRSTRAYVPAKSIPSTSPIEINAPGVHIAIPSANGRRSPATGNRPTAAAAPRPTARQIAPGVGLPGFLQTSPRQAPAPGGPANTTLYGNGSGSVGGSTLLGIDGLFTIAVLLVGATWRRRSWDLSVLPRQSALLSLALDRPG